MFECGILSVFELVSVIADFAYDESINGLKTKRQCLIFLLCFPFIIKIYSTSMKYTSVQ